MLHHMLAVTGIKASAAANGRIKTEQSKQSHARAIKIPLFWFLIISGGL